jgi:hypothetical protein
MTSVLSCRESIPAVVEGLALSGLVDAIDSLVSRVPIIYMVVIPVPTKTTAMAMATAMMLLYTMSMMVLAAELVTPLRRCNRWWRTFARRSSTSAPITSKSGRVLLLSWWRGQ